MGVGLGTGAGLGLGFALAGWSGSVVVTDEPGGGAGKFSSALRKKTQRSVRLVFPMAFWFFSLGGGVLLFAYALYIRDPVFIIGQGLGLFVYLRNLYFVVRERRTMPVA